MSIQRSRKGLLLVGCAVLATTFLPHALVAENYSTWDVDGSGNWSSTTRWKERRIPEGSADDRNVFIDHAAAIATDADYSLLTGLVRLRFDGTASLDMRFELDHEDFGINNVQRYYSAKPANATMIKSGSGKLVHAVLNGFFPEHFIVTNGVLQLDAVANTDANRLVSYGVSGDGLLAFNSPGACIAGLEGDGLATNMLASTGAEVKFYGTNVFAGTLASGFSPSFLKGVHYFTNSSNEHFNVVRIYDSVVGVTCFGRKASGSSPGFGTLGSNSDFASLQRNAGLVYLGQGEETDKNLKLCNWCTSFTLDAGACGGLVFTADSDWVMNDCANSIPVYLTGSNAVACAFLGKVSSTAASGTFNIVKRGSGVWNLGSSNRGSVLGTVSVEEGTLEYGSMAEKGKAPCSLGPATRLAVSTGGAYSSAPKVPWAYLLGTHSTTGAFVYVGSENVVCTGRLFAVKGHGIVRSKTSASLDYSGATTVDEEGGVLMLDGTGAEDRFSNITNGVGPIAVEKVGSGTWTLEGDLVLGGGLFVRQGTLRIANPDRYSWYRMSVKRLWGDFQIQLSQLGLFDEYGDQQNLGMLEQVDAIGHVENLLAGRSAFDHTVTGDADRRLGNLFLGEDGLMNLYRTHSVYPDPEKPSTWLCWTMRLKAGAEKVRYYDVKSHVGMNADGTMFKREPRTWVLEASVDGRKWDVLHDVDEAKVSKQGCTWYSSDSSTFDPEHPGFEISAAPPTRRIDIDHVGISGGATLVADSALEISTLVVDGAGGTLQNVRFATSGLLEVTGEVKGAVRLPLVLVDAKDAANLSKWKLKINGEINTRYTISVSDEGVTILPPGSVIIIR